MLKPSDLRPFLWGLARFQCALPSDNRQLQQFWKNLPQATAATLPAYSKSLAESWSIWGLTWPPEALGQWMTHVEIWKLISSAGGQALKDSFRFQTFQAGSSVIIWNITLGWLLLFPVLLSSFPQQLFWKHFHNANLISRPDSGQPDLKHNFSLFLEF